MPLPLRARRDEGLDVLDPHQRQPARRRQPAEAQELADQPPQVGVVRRREPLDLVRGDRGAEHAAKIRQHDLRGAAAGSGRGSGRSPAPRCARARPAPPPTRWSRSCVSDSDTARMRWRPIVASALALRHDLRRAVVVARDREIRGLDLAQRRLAREQLDAGFLGGEARREAGGAARAVAAVGELLRGKEAGEVGRRRLARAAARSARSRPCRCRSGGTRRARPPCRDRASGGANHERGVGAGEAAGEDQRDVAARRLRAGRHGQAGAVVVEPARASRCRAPRAARARPAPAPRRRCRRRRSGARTPT